MAKLGSSQICSRCNSIFTIVCSPQKFCSRKCQQKAHKNECPCGSVFFTRMIPGSRGVRKYCSKKCRETYGLSRQALGSQPTGPKDSHLKECKICSRSFTGKYNSELCLDHKTIKCQYAECECSLRRRLTGIGQVKYCSAEHRQKDAINVIWSDRHQPRVSKGELALIPLLTGEGFEHTGNKGAWFTWKDGTHHNPDFVDRANRRIVEYFGTYWHRNDIGKEDVIVSRWSEIGWDCRIIWEDDDNKVLSWQT